MATAIALWLVAGQAEADPQGNAGLTIGGAAVGTRGRFWDDGEFHLGLRGDVMFLREQPLDWGLGPYLEVGTLAFDEIQAGGGASVHVPVNDALPLVASLGGYARYGDDEYGAEPGIAGAIFWGSRSYNFHAGYVMAAGLSVGYRYSFGESHETALLVAAQLDLAILGLPLVLLINAARGGKADAVRAR